MSNNFGNNIDEYVSGTAGPIGNGSFDETIQRQVEQFNQRLRYSAELHQHFLAALCAERVQSEVEKLHDELVRPPGVVRRVLRRLRAERGRPIPPGTSTYERWDEQNSQHAGDDTTIIAGEFRVIEDGSTVDDQHTEVIPIHQIRRKEETHDGKR